jgi:ferric iron reductase protein FhuF
LVRTEGFLGALVGVLSVSGKRRICCCRYLVKKINRCQAGNV